MIKKENKIIDLKGANSTMKLGFVLYSVMVRALHTLRVTRSAL